MHFQVERARTAEITAESEAMRIFGISGSGAGTVPGQNGCGFIDAVFLDGARTRILAANGLLFKMPVTDELMRDPVFAAFAESAGASVLVDYSGDTVRIYTRCAGEPAEECESPLQNIPLKECGDEKLIRIAGRIYQETAQSRGELTDKGELLIDLKARPIGPHYPVNLLLGFRGGFPSPLFMTPKSAVDAFGSGSFRADGMNQVLATRCTLWPEENGEPVNRQFYLYENGKQIFYSHNVYDNVKTAYCLHSQNRTVITYETEDGLIITRTIFLLPMEAGMPDAVEMQHVVIKNRSGRARRLRIVFTGAFGIANPETEANDIIYASIVHQSEILSRGGRPVVITLHNQPAKEHGERKFAAIFVTPSADGSGTAGNQSEDFYCTMDDFCTNYPEFIGRGSLLHPESGAMLPSRLHRNFAPFFAMGKSFDLAEDTAIAADTLTGRYILNPPEEVTSADGTVDIHWDPQVEFDDAIEKLTDEYSRPGAAEKALQRVIDFEEKYNSYLRPETEDRDFNAYVGRNMPFQVRYQTYVSRAFAWTQKSYRETGFREIQDIYASMYYMNACGMPELAKELLSTWAGNVFPMGYAYHDFTWCGKEPGTCSDDQLWLVQAVYRYCTMTGDYRFLTEELPVAGDPGNAALYGIHSGKRPLLETLRAILLYSGRISVGVHGLPLLDHADWNDTLRLDQTEYKGPEKEALYRKQLAESGMPWGSPFVNTLCESVMNACLLAIAADETAELAEKLAAAGGTGRTDKAAEIADLAHSISSSVKENTRKYAWKGDYYARALINDGRTDRMSGKVFTYLGAGGDGLSADPSVDSSYFLNSFGWSILAGIADEEQIGIMLDAVEKYLKTDAGLRLCTLVAYGKLDCETGTSLYYPGDRENGGVFKHAAMMSTAAALRAAKNVKDETLAARLRSLAWFMINKTLPYKTMEHPYITKGNPRFCTQYNNSETGENIGPMLSGTASWLTLSMFEALGVNDRAEGFSVAPCLPEGTKSLAYCVVKNDTMLEVRIHSDGIKFRRSTGTVEALDGSVTDEGHTLQTADGKTGFVFPSDGGRHILEITL